MIEIEAPDGSIVEFPDGTPDHVMSSAMRKAFGGPAPAAQPSGVMDTLAPQPGKAAQAVTDVVGLMAKGAAMGKEQNAGDLADRSAALMDVGRRFGGRAKQPAPMSMPEAEAFLQGERQNMAAAAKRAGSAAPAAEILGAIVGAGKVGEGVAVLGNAAKAAPVVGRVASSPLAQSVATGGLLGASEAAGTDKDMLLSALMGGGLGAAGHAVGSAVSAGVSKAAGAFNKQPVLPTLDQLKAAKSAAYKAADDAEVVYTPQLIDRLRKNIQDTFAEKAFLPANQQKVANVLAEIDKLEGKNVTMKGLDSIRQMAGDAYEIGNKKSNSLAYDIISHIDDVLAKPKAGEVLMGNAAAGSKAILEARKLNTQVSKLTTIEQALEKAKLNTAASGTGGNIDNAIRQQIKAILINPAKSRGFTADEKALMEQVVRGTPGQNTARLLGRLSPQGNGLMAALQGMTALQTGGASIPAMGVGAVAKGIADRATPANVEKLAKVLRAGGKASDAFAPKNSVQNLAEKQKQLLIRALIGGGVTLAPTP